MSEDIIGRRRPDIKYGNLPDDLQAGDYWKYLERDTGEPMILDSASRWSSNLTHTVWGYYSPDGNGIGTLMVHTVREHETGRISVLPGDGSSNSILHSGGAQHLVWHGYIYDGVWREC